MSLFDPDWNSDSSDDESEVSAPFLGDCLGGFVQALQSHLVRMVSSPLYEDV